MSLCASAIPSPSFFENHCGLRHFIYLMYYSKLESPVCVSVCVCMLSRVRLFVTPWTVALQAPLEEEPGISRARMLEWVAISFSRGTVL